MTDFRAELQALVTAYDNHGGRWPQHHEDALSGAVERARFALKADRPSTRLAVHPDGTPMVSNGEAADLDTITRLAADPEHSRAVLGLPEPPAKGEVADEDLDAMWDTEAEYFALYSEARRFARAILARFGGHPAPTPVSEHPDEREGWCDSDGRCWWGRRADSTSNADWFYATWAETIVFCEHSMPQFSLPHDALPLPTTEHS